MVLSEILLTQKHNTMYTDKKVGYLAPEVEVNEVMVEQGIAVTGEDPVVDPEQGWD